jgi:Cysteine-rich secretory protein family
MSATTVRIALHFSALTLACAACAPTTDQAPRSSSGNGVLVSAGSPPSAAGTLASATAGTGSGLIGSAAGSGALVPGVPGSGTPGSAGRGLTVGAAGMLGLPGGAAGMFAGRAGAPSVTGGVGGGSVSGTAGAAAGGSTGGGSCGSSTATDGRPTTGPLACIVEQHNAVRAMVMSATPLPPVTWSADMAKYAQEWTDMTCMSPKHRTMPSLNGKPLGENLYASSGLGDKMAGKEAVDGWAGEVACYTYGTFMKADKCDMTCTSKMNSDGCGHYTQVVWRASIEIGCGVTTCGSGFNMQTEVICNYGPAGNYIGMNPY